MHVQFTNGSSRTIDHANLGLLGRIPETVHNIIDYPERVEIDRTIKPGETVSECYYVVISARYDPSDAAYQAFVISVSFAD